MNSINRQARTAGALYVLLAVTGPFTLMLLAAGVSYVLLSLTAILRPDSYEPVFRLGTPLRWGELGILLWLLFKGAKTSSDGESTAVLAPATA
jgi:hypothetical protein